MPIDMPLWNLVQENKAAVIAALMRRFDPSQGSENPIYSPEGGWSYERFAQWLVAAGISEWPRLESGELEIEGDAFRLMYPAHPAIEGLHALRDASASSCAPDSDRKDGRNRPSLFPFATATGRNAQAKSLFNAHASMRSFMRFPPDKIGLYLDWRTQEVGVAAARSGDEALAQAYLSGDVYHSLALLCGLTTTPTSSAGRPSIRDQRQRMKALQLGINYGMGVRSLARGLGSPSADRQRNHPTTSATISAYWPWRAEHGREGHVGAGDRERVYGWPLHISHCPEQAHAVQFPDAIGRRRDVAAGGQPAVRGRHGADHAGARRDPARTR